MCVYSMTILYAIHVTLSMGYELVLYNLIYSYIGLWVVFFVVVVFGLVVVVVIRV